MCFFNFVYLKLIIDFFWDISLQNNGFCCVDYYRDVELRLCKCKNGDVYVFFVLLFDI